jgi:carbon starvation protein
VNAALVAVFSLIIFGVGYKYYGDVMYDRVMQMDPGRYTPAHEQRDGVDYVPTNRWILFGHHFASISGLGPIVGPAIAVIWGWLPALLWIVFGTLLIGAVHDFTTMSVSVRNDGRSIGDVAAQTITERSRFLFLVLIFFLITLAMGVFAYVIAVLFAQLYPQTVLPVFGLMVIALSMGVLLRKGMTTLRIASLAGLVLLGLLIWHSLGISVVKEGGVAQSLVVPFLGGPVQLAVPGIDGWTYILMGYAFVASVLPVWLLLQPRDYLNSFLLYIGLIGLYCGLFWMAPTISAPAVTSSSTVPDLPPLFPILFITIACGAISGFHSLVSSGTTAKQLDSEEDGKFVGFGGMIAEGVLALIVMLACVAGIGGFEAWKGHYTSWAEASGLGAKLSAFIDGGAAFLNAVGISMEAAQVFISLVAVSFAMTTLDSGTRLLRYNIEEIADSLSGSKDGIAGVNRYTSSLLAVAAIGFFALLEVPVHSGGETVYQPAGIFLWVLFGASNQLLAALGLLTVTVYLYKRQRPVLYTLLPMIFMVIITVNALAIQFFKQMPLLIRRPLAEIIGLESMTSSPGSWIIFGMVLVISGLAGWFVIESILAYRRYSPEESSFTQEPAKKQK